VKHTSTPPWAVFAGVVNAGLRADVRCSGPRNRERLRRQRVRARAPFELLAATEVRVFDDTGYVSTTDPGGEVVEDDARRAAPFIWAWKVFGRWTTRAAVSADEAETDLKPSLAVVGQREADLYAEAVVPA
jgi:hypothetical protein